MFDDHSFSQSKLYHWIIKTCYEISNSIETNLRFINNFENNQLAKLQGRAHPYEKSGLAHWMARLREETTELDAMQIEAHAFKEQVRELVCSTFWPYTAPFLFEFGYCTLSHEIATATHADFFCEEGSSERSFSDNALDKGG